MSNRDIDFGDDEGATVVGRTRSGKTTGTLKSLERQKRGVIFFNTQQIPFPRKWIEVDSDTEFGAIVHALQNGEKLVYTPRRETRQQEIRIMIKLLYKAAEAASLDIFVVVDEIHLYEKDALKACIELATTGIRWGLKPIWISQRPAKIDNTLMTQSTRFVFFDISNMEAPYLKNYQIPPDIYPMLVQGGKYAYVVYDGHTIEGPHKVSL